MGSAYLDRIRELQGEDSDVVAEAGATLGVWIPDSLRLELEALASDVGISRSSMARELLTIAIAQARDDLELGDRGQLELEMPNTAALRPKAQVKILKPRRSPGGAVAKPRRKADKGRSRARGK